MKTGTKIKLNGRTYTVWNNDYNNNKLQLLDKNGKLKTVGYKEVDGKELK